MLLLLLLLLVFAFSPQVLRSCQSLFPAEEFPYLASIPLYVRHNRAVEGAELREGGPAPDVKGLVLVRPRLALAPVSESTYTTATTVVKSANFTTTTTYGDGSGVGTSGDTSGMIMTGVTTFYDHLAQLIMCPAAAAATAAAETSATTPITNTFHAQPNNGRRDDAIDMVSEATDTDSASSGADSDSGSDCDGEEEEEESMSGMKGTTTGVGSAASS